MTSNQEVQFMEKIMFFLIVFIPLLFVIVGLVIGLSLVLANKTENDREKASPFECGFDRNSSSRLPFSLRFFLITIIFLIFDVEIILLLPAIYALSRSLIINWRVVFLTFILILFLGLVHEWKQGALNWTF